MGAIDAANGKTEEAARLYREGMARDQDAGGPRRQHAQRSFVYAEQLLASPLKEFANPQQALWYARKAAQASQEARWVYLDQVARASRATGDAAGAVEQERKAIALLPAASPKRKELEGQLLKFEAALK